MNHIISYLSLLLRILFNFLPPKKQISFNSFHGMYSDSPRYISELVHERLPDVQIIWEAAPKSHEQLPAYIKPVAPGSVAAVYADCTSRITVDNYMGAVYGHTASRLKAAILRMAKQKRQFSICTWHGTALKKINQDEPCNIGKKLYFYSSGDLLMCGNQFMKELYDRQSKCKLRTVLMGTPRNDILFDCSDEKKLRLKERLCLSADKKIVLFAPTFRESQKTNEMLQNIDYHSILNACKARFGGEWVFVFRAHDSLVENLKGHAADARVLSGNVGDDMAEYLAVTDILITDYSSSMFDYLLTKRPCYLYCPDLEEYSTVERGLYFSLDELPFTYGETIDAVVENICSFRQDEYQKKAEEFLYRIGNVEDGTATQKIVDLIVEKMG